MSKVYKYIHLITLRHKWTCIAYDLITFFLITLLCNSQRSIFWNPLFFLKLHTYFTQRGPNHYDFLKVILIIHYSWSAYKYYSDLWEAHLVPIEIGKSKAGVTYLQNTLYLSKWGFAIILAENVQIVLEMFCLIKNFLNCYLLSY